MWRFKQFMPKEQTGLEGRTIDIGNLKVHIRNSIAEGGFSCVYLARDAINGSKQYALKHIICNDEESLELVMKEISVMKLLKGHPNVVTLYTHTFFDMGRTKEALLVMEYCEKSLVNVLESRGAAYFNEKQILAIFRDICNAVFAMHSQSPPIAHRDLKAENLLLGSDGLWKLCDFGSTSTNHKRFEKPEEMGIEEDNIRKHTTPAYRAPEMWDLYRRELINEKVDIWALGCLFFRICYFKSAFDGESKLQILNGNYRIPELPKYSSAITNLIRDMLQSSPDARPDITQVWFRVNDLLPEGLQKSLPDRPPEIQQHTDHHEGNPSPSNKSNPMPRRSPPPPPSNAETSLNMLPQSVNSRASGGGNPLGAFWSTQHAKDSIDEEEKNRLPFEDELIGQKIYYTRKSTSKMEENVNSSSVQKNVQGKSVNRSDDGSSEHGAEWPKASKSESTHAFQSEAFNAFAAEFSATKLSPKSNIQKSEKEGLLEAEVERLKEQLRQANVEKAEITSKYEKLSAICRSQRQEIQELKQTLTSRTESPNKDATKNQSGKIEGTVWELQQGLFDKSSPGLDPKPWQAFADDSKPQTTPTNNTSKSARTRISNEKKQAAEANPGTSTWGFGTEGFTAIPAVNSQISPSNNELGNSQRFGASKNRESKPASQPAGWAGF